jgi:predicted CXXCH cytochrome family protein
MNMQRRLIICVMAGLLAVVAALAVSTLTARADDGDGYTGPEFCGKCHPEQSEAWGSAPHANAAKVDAFVKAWEEAKSPGYCLTCHTTGYDPNSGLYVSAGVTCESCHGPFQPGHPAEPMEVDTSPEACGQCHQSTLKEWEFSQHGEENIGCVSCHDVHGSTVKTGQATELCGKCHSNASSDFAHASSAGQGLTCADCHIGPRTGDPAEGHADTGHTFIVGTGTCSRCHADEIHEGVQAMMGGGSPLPAPTATAEPVAETEASGVATAGMALPVVGSVALGASLGFGWARWRERKE